jgi:hypothetical protein
VVVVGPYVIKYPALGDIAGTHISVGIDVPRLLVSRMLVQANSGAGKSWALRRILEQTYGHCQHIVLDPEGEFHTLREENDYVLAGKGGDCPADLRTATLLARRLLELRTSAIVDISELGAARAQFVKLFLESLVSAPRALWHPVIVVVDEAQLFCPERGRGEAVSTDAVIGLMTLGRKRGFAGILATQRISKLNKDAAADCNNKLIGRAALDVDTKRAGEELGMHGRDEQQTIRKMPPGEFFAFGPALSGEVVRVKIGPVTTTHPEPGDGGAMLPTPPSAATRKILAQLADLPHEAEEEAKTAADLRARVKVLERELAAGKTTVVEKEKIVERIVIKPSVPPVTLLALEALANLSQEALNKAREIQRQSDQRQPEFKNIADLHPHRDMFIGKRTSPALVSTDGYGNEDPNGRFSKPAANGHNGVAVADVPPGERKFLAALIQNPEGLRREQFAVLTGYKRSSRDSYISRLLSKGMVTLEDEIVRVTPAGIAALPDVEPLPTGRALQEHWLAKLPRGEQVILQILLDIYPESIVRATINLPEFKRSSRDSFISRLISRGLVTSKRGAVRASEGLFS